MNRISHYRFEKLETTNIAIVIRKNIAAEKGFL
jgi:hypothetical protein